MHPLPFLGAEMASSLAFSLCSFTSQVAKRHWPREEQKATEEDNTKSGQEVRCSDIHLFCGSLILADSPSLPVACTLLQLPPLVPPALLLIVS
jgi:hypothetical protein